MRKRPFITVIISAIALLLAPYMQATGSSATDSPTYPSGQSVGLVLSGGGAKGIAHIGVIQALEDHNIPIDFVAGTSMGAIVGGLYACGYTPQEMMELLLSKEFALWSTGQTDPSLNYYFLQRPQTPAFAHLNVNVGGRDSTSSGGIMPSSLISPLPMNFAFMDLFSGYTAQCQSDFDKLFVPFRCVASDVTHKHKVVLRSGSVGDAIRASMSFPAVFLPISINGVELYDGGIYDNFPVDVMREDFAPGIMIGVDVHTEDAEPSQSIVSQLENMIIQKNDYTLPADEGIRIHVDVSQFSLLDFQKAREIYAIGYRRGMEMMDSIEQRITSRIPPETRRLRRSVFKSASPYLRFDSVNVKGGSPGQNEYLTRLFENAKHHADTFGIEAARLAYYRALTPGRLRNLFPQARFNPSTGLFALDLTADVKNNFSIGAGGYLTSSVNSMIFLSTNYSTLAANSWSTSLMGWIGQSYMAAQADVQMLFSHTRPSALEFQGVVARQRYYESNKLFYEDNSPAFITHRDMFARISYAYAAGRRAKVRLCFGAGQSHNTFYSTNIDDFLRHGPEETKMNLAQAILRFDYNTLNSATFPTAGANVRITAMQTLGKYHHTLRGIEGKRIGERYSTAQKWFQAELYASKYFTFGDKVSVGTTVDALVSNRKLLNTYYASVVCAPSFTPFDSMQDLFNKEYHANSFIAAGLTPVWEPFQRAQVRLAGYAFLPFRRIMQNELGEPCHGRWFADPRFLGEIDLVYNLPFAAISGYVHYLSSPKSTWGAGISFGLYFTASRFLR